MKTAICAIIKDEHLFLEEWIEWHLGIGFDAIHIFEDKGSKSHEGICDKYSNVYLRRYEEDEEVQKLLSYEGSYRQLALYNWFGDTYQDKYDWVAFIDLDEFFVFDNGYTLDILCKEFSEYPAVTITWKMIGASGNINRPSTGVIQAYTEVVDFMKQDYGWCYKSFCNMKKWMGMKHLHLAYGAVNTNHNQNIYEILWDKVYLNHYFSKSWEDWCDRIFKRGGIVNSHRTLDLFFDINPSMKHLKEELMSEVSDRIPVGTYWLDKDKTIIAGGNVRKIMALNKKL